MLDVKKGIFVSDQAILISNGRIQKIAAWSTLAGKVSVEKSVDLSRSIVLPGLIDAHTHLLMNSAAGSRYVDSLLFKSVAYRVLEGAKAAKLTLESGFTTVRDVESEGAGFGDVALRDGIANNLVIGPRMKVATKGIVALGSYYPLGLAPEFQSFVRGAQNISGVEEARRAVREQLEGGADLIKIYADFRTRKGEQVRPTLDQDEVNMVVLEAHKAGRKVAAHATSPEGISHAIEAGVDSIEHGYDINLDLIKKMSAKSIALVPTSNCLFDLLKKSVDKSEIERTSARITNLKVMIKAARKSGVSVVCGSDSSSEDSHGRNYDEIESLEKIGLTRVEAIQSATINAAKLLSLDSEIGSLEEGKVADIIAVSGDPLNDLKSLESVDFVMKDGVVYKQK